MRSKEEIKEMEHKLYSNAKFRLMVLEAYLDEEGKEDK